jgi:hypothetical protein
MPRKTRRQLVGKQEDIDREERETALRGLAWELHLAWMLGDKKSERGEVEPSDQAESQCRAKILLLTLPIGTR